MFGILAGLGVRAAPHAHAYNHSHPHAHGHYHDHQHAHAGHQDHDCHGEPADFHNDVPLNDGHAPDPNSPQGEHHHQHVCCHNSPLAVDRAEASRLSLLDFSLIGVTSKGIRIPAEPVFELDTPPLI